MRASTRTALGRWLLAGTIGLLLGFVPAVALPGGLGAPAASAAPGPGVFLLGDSVLAGAASTVQAKLSAAYPAATIDAQVCRGLARSCTSPTTPTAPTTGMDEIASRAHDLGDVVVVELGANDQPTIPQIDAAMTAFSAHDVATVLWLNLPTAARDFSAFNARLAQEAGRWPTLRVLDWDAATKGHPDWIVADGVGVHLAGAGQDAFAAFLKSALDDIPGIGVPPPAALHCTGAVGVGKAAAPPVASTGAVPTGAGRFTGTQPKRLLDTRLGRPVGAGRTITLQVTGRASVPATAQAAVLNVTAVGGCTAGFVTVFPCDSSGPPLASNLNFVRSSARANLAVAALGTGGRACVYTSAQVDVVVDLMGWIDPKASGAATPTAPKRALDTRDGTGQPAGGALKANTLVTLTVADDKLAPSDAGAVILNVTAVPQGVPGFLTVFPAAADGTCAVADLPTTSNVNYGASAIVPNLVMVRVGGLGRVCVFSNAPAHVVADLAGSFRSTGVAVQAASPYRVLDTRDGTGTAVGANGAKGAIAAGGVATIGVASADGHRAPLAATGVILNVTAVAPAAKGFVTVWPAAADGSCRPEDRPLASNLNVDPGDVVPNLVTAAVGGAGRVCLYSQAKTDLVADLTGWMA